MLRQSGRASDLARSFVDDGDDLQMTPSFYPSEENSSIAGNMSVTVSVHTKKRFTPSKRNGLKSLDEDIDRTTDASISDHSDEVSSIGDDETTDVPYERRSHRRSLTLEKVIQSNKAVKKGLDNAQKLLATRTVKSFLMKKSLSSRALTEYQEIKESEDGPENPPILSSLSQSGRSSIRSIRSGRINIATGRSLLVRQNAQVMGRPSVAQQEWDIGTIYSSSESSSSVVSTVSRRRRGSSSTSEFDIGGRSVRSVRSDISRLTGDSFHSRHSDFTMSRAMFIDQLVGPNLLGGTTDEDDDDIVNTVEEHEEDFQVNDYPEDFHRLGWNTDQSKPLRRKVNDYVLSAEDDFSQISELHLRGANSDDGLFSPRAGVLPVRERVLSDSEFLFEMLRRRRRLSAEYNHDSPYNQDDIETDQRSPNNLIRSASFSDYLFPPSTSDIDSTQQQRPRCMSAGHVENITHSEDGDGMNFLKDLDFIKDTITPPNIPQRSIPMSSTDLHRIWKEGTSKLPSLHLPAFAKGKQSKGGHRRTDSIPLLSAHGDDEDDGDDEETSVKVTKKPLSSRFVYNKDDDDDDDENEEHQNRTAPSSSSKLDGSFQQAIQPTRMTKTVSSTLPPPVPAGKKDHSILMYRPPPLQSTPPKPPAPTTHQQQQQQKQPQIATTAESTRRTTAESTRRAIPLQGISSRVFSGVATTASKNAANAAKSIIASALRPSSVVPTGSSNTGNGLHSLRTTSSSSTNNNKAYDFYWNNINNDDDDMAPRQDDTTGTTTTFQEELWNLAKDDDSYEDMF